MKYRVTPGNLFCLFVLGMYLYCSFNKDNSPNQLGIGIVLSYVIFFSIFVFVIDCFLQYFIESHKKVLIIESILIPFVILFISSL